MEMGNVAQMNGRRQGPDVDRSLEDPIPYLFALLGTVDGIDPVEAGGSLSASVVAQSCR
jgi:hypothetical protein